MNELFRPLQRRTFGLLWGATVLANLGFWVQDITLGWLITSRTTSPSLVALVPAATLLPMFLLSLPAGVLGDVVDRRRLLIATQAAMAIVLVLFVIALLFDSVSVLGILAFAFVGGTLAAISGPARQAILPSLVAPAEIRSAVMLSAIGYNGTRALGPLVGGIILAAFGPITAVGCYAVACLIVGAVLAGWKGSVRGDRRRLEMRRDIAAGLHHIFGNRGLREALLFSFVFFMGIAPLWAFAPLVAKGFAHGNSRIFSLVMMAIGLGAVVGGLSRHLNGGRGFMPALRNGAFVTAVALAIVSLASQLVPALIGFLLAGIGWIAVSAGINSYVLLEAGAAYRTRAIAVTLIVFSGGLTAGSLIWGQVARAIGVGPTFGVAAAGLALLGIVVALRTTRAAALIATS